MKIRKKKIIGETLHKGKEKYEGNDGFLFYLYFLDIMNEVDF